MTPSDAANNFKSSLKMPLGLATPHLCFRLNIRWRDATVVNFNELYRILLKRGTVMQ